MKDPFNTSSEIAQDEAGIVESAAQTEEVCADPIESGSQEGETQPDTSEPVSSETILQRYQRRNYGTRDEAVKRAAENASLGGGFTVDDAVADAVYDVQGTAVTSVENIYSENQPTVDYSELAGVPRHACTVPFTGENAPTIAFHGGETPTVAYTDTGSSAQAAYVGDDSWTNPATTQPLNVQAVAAAVAAANGPQPPVVDMDPAPSKKHGSHVKRWLGVAASVAILAVVGMVGYLNVLTGTAQQISDAQVVKDLSSDESFLQGSASDTFVSPAEYKVESVEVTSKDSDGTNVVVNADVTMSNGYFSESRAVTVNYAYADGHWSHDYSIDSHSVKALRGIDGDDEYGVSAEDAAFDEANQSCIAYQDVNGGENDPWYKTTSGTQAISYVFADDTWSRSGVDYSQVACSFQNLAGSYQGDGGSSAMWTVGDSAGKLQDLEITWVDDEAGQFGGSFVWSSGSSRYMSFSSEEGEFVGYFDEAGNLSATADGTAGTLGFVGVANDDGGISLDYSVFYNDGVESFFGGENVYEATGSTTLYKQGESYGSGDLDPLFGGWSDWGAATIPEDRDEMAGKQNDDSLFMSA